jgi:hypothetical protein
MNDNSGANVLVFERPGRGGTGMGDIGGVVQSAISAASRLQSGAAGLLQQVEADKENIARAQSAAASLTMRVEALRATADTFLAALREENDKDR